MVRRDACQPCPNVTSLFDVTVAAPAPAPPSVDRIFMGQLRTANKRRKNGIFIAQERKELSKVDHKAASVPVQVTD